MLSVDDEEVRARRALMLTSSGGEASTATPAATATTGSPTPQVNYGGPNPEDATGGMGTPATSQPAPSQPPTGAQTPATQTPATSSNPATGAELTSAQIAQILQARPDIQAEWQRVRMTADPNSPNFQAKGLSDVESFTRYWYDSLNGSKEINLSAQPTGTPAEQTAGEITKDATTATDQAASALDGSTKAIIDALSGQNTSLTQLIAQQNEQFKSAQSDLLKQFSSAQGDTAKRMSELVSQMQAMQTGQAAKKPNYAQALAKNKLLNANGVGSTMLSGPGGVASTAMTLGRTSLVGA